MLEKLKTALAATGIPFAHVAWTKPPAGDYMTFQEDGSNNVYADNVCYCQYFEGTIDIYTKNDDGTILERLQNALTDNDIQWDFSDSDYDDETGLIHYQYDFEV